MNFGYAIESRDGLPVPETLEVKILEECDGRRHKRKKRKVMLTSPARATLRNGTRSRRGTNKVITQRRKATSQK